MKKLFLIPLVLSTLFGSCSKDLETTPDIDFGVSMDASSGYRTYENALTELGLFMDYDAVFTRAGKKPKIKDYRLIYSNNSTRGEVAEPLYYIMNFEDEDGFAFVAANFEAEPVLVLTEAGNYYPEEESDNPGFNLYLQMMEDYLGSLKAPAIKFPPVTGPGEEPLPEDKYYVYGPWITTSYASLPVVTKWRQGDNSGSVYNKYVPMIDGQYCKAGCVPIALAQIIAAYEHPSYYNGLNFPWAEMKKFSNAQNLHSDLAKDRVGQLISLIGSIASTDYGLSNSATYNSKYTVVLNSFGFNCEPYVDWNVEWAKSSIKNYGPIIMSGQSTDGGHGWVAEEIILKWREVEEVINGFIKPGHSESLFYVKINWGWGGYHDGYFANNVFNYNKSIDMDTRSTGPDHYVNIKMVIDIRPK